MLLEWLRRHQNIVVPGGLLVFSLLLLSLQSYRTMKTSLLSRGLLTIVGLGQGLVTGTTEGLSDLWNNYFWLREVEETNQKLVKENESLNRRIILLQNQADENERLRRLLNFEPKGDIKSWIPAEVIGRSMTGLNRTITINKGSYHGIRPRMAVFSYDSAVIGQILDEPGSMIGPLTSQVLLITDRRSMVPVLVRRSRVSGTVAGRPENNDCILLDVTRLDDLQVGDDLITSGYGGVFMKGFPIGKIIEVVNDPSQLSPGVTVRPDADFSRLEEVMVIVAE
jgi:rod shape-determining protein MreC